MSVPFIDFHTHILPGIDSGCVSPEQCARQLSFLRDAGAAAAVATSLYDPAKCRPAVYLERQRKAVEMLLRQHRPGDVTVYLGTELLLCPEIDRLAELDALTVFGTDIITIRMPPAPYEDWVPDVIFGIRDSGFRVVVTGVERIPAAAAESLFAMEIPGVIDLRGFRSLNPSRLLRYRKWIDEGKIVAVGTGLDNEGERAFKNVKLTGSILGEKRLSAVASSSARLLSGAVPVERIRY